MKLNRRSFLFGSAAALGVVALAPYLEQITWPDGPDRPDGGYKLRKLYKLGISSPVKGDNAVMEFSLKRWPTNATLHYMTLNARACYVWLPQPGWEPIFTDKSLMLVEATGCPAQITIGGQDDGRWLTERYSFPGPYKERWLMS